MCMLMLAGPCSACRYCKDSGEVKGLMQQACREYIDLALLHPGRDSALTYMQEVRMRLHVGFTSKQMCLHMQSR